MQQKIDDLTKSVDRIDMEVDEVKKDIQGIIREQDLNSYKNDALLKTLEKVEQKLINIHSDVTSFKEELKAEINITKEDIRKESYVSFVTKDQYFPVKTIVYGLVGLILTTVVAALLALIIVNPLP